MWSCRRCASSFWSGWIGVWLRHRETEPVSTLLSAFLSWHLGQLARSTPTAAGFMGWAFFILQLPGVVLSFLYFGPPPMVLSVVVALILGCAAWLTGR